MNAQTEQEPRPELQSTLQLMVADADPVFRLGLITLLQQASTVQVVAEAARPNQVLASLAQLSARDLSSTPDGLTTDRTTLGQQLPIDLVILDPYMGQLDQDVGSALCQQLKLRYPSLPILVLASQIDPSSLIKLWQTGIEGCLLKGTDMEVLLQRLSRIAEGERVWDSILQAQLQVSHEPRPAPSAATSGQWRSLTQLRYNLCQSGLNEMAMGLSQLEVQLQSPQLARWQHMVLAGRRREIRAAQWLVRQLLPTVPPDQPDGKLAPMPPSQSSVGTQFNLESGSEPASPLVEINRPTVDLAATQMQFGAIKSLLLDNLLAKLPTSLQNQTNEPFEIDILKASKKQELFCIILRHFENTLDELRFSQVQRSQLSQKEGRILQDLWQAAITDFFGKYLTLPLSGASRMSETDEIEIVSVLLQDRQVVQTDILDKIPLVLELLEHLLYQVPLVVNNSACAVGSPEAVLQAEALLANLVVQVANGVIQPLLNHFATTEVIKQSFYDRRLISTREIERFRNALSWKYRLKRSIVEPKNIFESQFTLLVFSESGLKKSLIYAPRDEELKQLSGLQLAVTLALETRDAIAPPLRSTVTFLGQGVVYLLTQVIGRGIGLIGRGILQGAGHAWQDLNLNRKGQQDKGP